jgi:WD40 repeat protein
MSRFLPMSLLLIGLCGCSKSGPSPQNPQTTTPVDQPANGAQLNAPSTEADLSHATPIARIKTSLRKINRIFLSNDGSRVLVDYTLSARDMKCEIWDLKPQPKKVSEIPGEIIALSPDGKKLLLPSKDAYQAVDVLDVESGKKLGKIPTAGRFQFFIDSDLVLLVWPNNTPESKSKDAIHVAVYNLKTGVQQPEFKIPSEGPVKLTGIINDRKEIAFAWHSKGRMEIWDIATGKIVSERTFPPDSSLTEWSCFDVSNDGKYAFIKRWANEPVKVYDFSSGNELAFKMLESYVIVPNGDLILESAILSKNSSSWMGWKLKEFTSGKPIAFLPDSSLINAISANGRIFASTHHSTSEVLIWDLSQINKVK